MTMGARVENQPTDSSPRNWWLMSAAAEYRPSACFNNCFASRSNARPAGVSDKPCAWWRRNNCTFSSRSMCEIAVETAGWEILARFDAAVMLPVSAAAIKYASCRKVNFIRPANSQITGDAEARSGAGVERAAHIVVDLRRVNVPGGRKRAERIMIVPVHPQIDDRPAHLVHHQQPRGMHRTRFAAPLRARIQRMQQTRAQMSGRGLECGHHRRGYVDPRQ